ncbi:hypothetical protein H0H92_010745 [Tricholoma furcatifolium]|nr:hypothetical protein H0H92_010745 [Tricholoma furcatifolium]
MKTRLRDRLRSRKFEMEHVERSFRKQVNDQKLDEHTASSVHRRDPTISRLASNYNRVVETMEELIKTRKAPSHAICPQKIDTKGLYALDVDDTIWQDSGLNDDDDSPAPPPWLANEKVREGIKVVLLYDRCLEERARLQHECRSMRIWFAEEWKVLNLAMDTDDNSLRFFLTHRREYLSRICIRWQKSTQGLDFGDLATLPEWGPSPEELIQARVAQVVLSVAQTTPSAGDNVDREVEDRSESEESDVEESGLADLLDTLDIAQAYGVQDSNDL